jgi:hypothetical protein
MMKQAVEDRAGGRDVAELKILCIMYSPEQTKCRFARMPEAKKKIDGNGMTSLEDTRHLH